MNFVKNEISKMWILWKMRFQKGEFCENWDFRKVNFVKNEISEKWILYKLWFSICEFLDFNVDFCSSVAQIWIWFCKFAIVRIILCTCRGIVSSLSSLSPTCHTTTVKRIFPSCRYDDALQQLGLTTKYNWVSSYVCQLYVLEKREGHRGMLQAKQEETTLPHSTQN